MGETYRLFDQQEKLGSPPWRHDDPALMAWEKAHGHDVRLKCYPEFSCLVIEDELERLTAEVRKLLVIAPGTDPDGENGERVIAFRYQRDHTWAIPENYPAIEAALAADPQSAEAGGEPDEVPR